MGYSYERGAAARNLLRARAHGHEDVIRDAETLAWMLLADSYGEDGDDGVEEYIADHYADFVPEPPVVTDDMGGGEPCEERALVEIAAERALRAAFNIKEN